MTIIITTSVDTDFWLFKQDQKESSVKSLLDMQIQDAISYATQGQDPDGEVTSIEFEYGKPV